jgi:hypothetical protein
MLLLRAKVLQLLSCNTHTSTQLWTHIMMTHMPLFINCCLSLFVFAFVMQNASSTPLNFPFSTNCVCMNPTTVSKLCKIHKKYCNIIPSSTSYCIRLQAQVIALDSYLEELKIRFSKHDDQLGKELPKVKVNLMELANEQKFTS